MKNVFKKFTITILVIIILFNFSVFENVCFADDAGSIINGLLGSFVGLITWLFRLPAVAIGLAINKLTAKIAYMDGQTAEGASAGASLVTITPYDIFFNHVQLFDINFFDFDIDQGSAVYQIRLSVSSWFTIMRLIAISILLVILIYVGIRMALTSIADDKARYKQMLIDWAVSLILVFVLHYIIIFAVNVNNALVKAIKAAADANDISGQIGELSKIAVRKFDSNALGATIIYCMLVWQTFGFVLSYTTRTIKLAFLMIISPLISITYSIDKMGDGKSQALNAWLKEFVFTILMQPFHCIIYITLVDMAFGLLDSSNDNFLAASVLAILCIRFIKTAEDLVRSIFAFQDDGKAGSMNAGALAAGAALSKAKDIGAGARKAVNFAKEAKVGEKLKTSAKKTRAALGALRETKEEKEARKQTGAEKPSFATRMKREEEKIDRKEAAKKEEKANRKAWKMHTKHKDNYTEEEKKSIGNTAKQIQKENPGMSDQEAYKRAAIKHSREKIASGAYQNKIVKGWKTFKKAARETGVTEVVGDMVRIGMQGGAAIFAGSATASGDGDLITAITAGAAMGKFTGEFMKNSSKTIASGMTEHLQAKGITSAEEAKDEVMDIKARGDNGGFDSDILKKIKKAITDALGQANGALVMDRITRKFNSGQYNFDINELLNEINKDLQSKKPPKPPIKIDETSLAAITSFKNFKHDSAIYQSIQTGEGAQISAQTLAEKAADEFELGVSEDTFVEKAKKTVVSTSTIKAVTYGDRKRTGDAANASSEHDLTYISAKLDEEIAKVDEQIRFLQEQLQTIGTVGKDAETRANINQNISNLMASRKMLEANKGNVNKISENIANGGDFEIPQNK